MEDDSVLVLWVSARDYGDFADLLVPNITGSLAREACDSDLAVVRKSFPVSKFKIVATNNGRVTLERKL